jgi:hypothetical protein
MRPERCSILTIIGEERRSASEPAQDELDEEVRMIDFTNEVLAMKGKGC